MNSVFTKSSVGCGPEIRCTHIEQQEFTVLCVFLCNQSYRDYIVYMKFCQSVLGFLFISTLRVRCQISIKHLFKPAALHCWGSASRGPCCHSAGVESLFEAKCSLVKVEILLSLSFCWVEHLKHAHGNLYCMSFFVVNNNGRSRHRQYQLPGSMELMVRTLLLDRDVQNVPWRPQALFPNKDSSS